MKFGDNNFNSIYLKVLQAIDSQPTFEGSSRGVGYKEIINLSFELSNPYARIVWNSARRANYDFAMKFFIWMLNGCNDAAYLTGINPNAKEYLDDKQQEATGPAVFSTAYGPRIVRQMDTICDELIRDPGSRRAVISILEEDDLGILGQDTKTEFPCIESLSFFIRDEKLHCLCNMRSNNMATTVVYDVFAFTLIQEYVFNRLRQALGYLEMGTYYHHCTSAHFFDNQQKLVDDILSNSYVAMHRIDSK